MYHIKISAPVTAKTRRIVKALSGATIERDSRDKSARFVVLPGWYTPEGANEAERRIHAAQR